MSTVSQPKQQTWNIDQQNSNNNNNNYPIGWASGKICVLFWFRWKIVWVWWHELYGRWFCVFLRTHLNIVQINKKIQHRTISIFPVNLTNAGMNKCANTALAKQTKEKLFNTPHKQHMVLSWSNRTMIKSMHVVLVS